MRWSGSRYPGNGHKMAVAMQTTDSPFVCSERRTGGSLATKRSQRLSRRKHMTVPSTNASIPSKYQVFFTNHDEKKGFTCQAPRFSGATTGNDNPGPGTYNSSCDPLDTQSVSSSQRGTGGFASKTRRFGRDKLSSLGPGKYSPHLPAPKLDFSKGGSSNFQKPLIDRSSLPLSSLPAPNSYELSEGLERRSVAATASFRSKTKRGLFNPSDRAHPAPGQYSVNDALVKQRVPSHSGVFKSKLGRGGFLQGPKGPGPGAYSPFEASAQSAQLTDKAQSKRKHYLCLSAPAIPPLPDPPPPGPGAYEVVNYAGDRKMSSDGAMFRSTTARWEAPVLEEDSPGPGSYFPRAPVKQSFLYNVHKQWI